jgi:molybdate transport system substrate-binding protein
VRRALLVTLVLAVLPSCGDGGPDETALTVLAASSLTDAFTEIAAAYEAQHEGVRVELSFDGSARLATAIAEGAPADVFASADEANARRVADAGLATGAPVVFATNRLQIVVAEGNPLRIRSLSDLDRVRLSLCQAAVPCGAYAAAAFERAGLPTPAAGDQESVKGVLTQVQLGEADAGLVYVTDVRAADDVEGIDLMPDQQIEAAYPAVAIDPDPDGAAAAFVAFLTSDEARDVLSRLGFGLP